MDGTTHRRIEQQELELPGINLKVVWIVALSFFMFFFLIIDIALGSVRIPLNEVINITMNDSTDNVAWNRIIQNIRIPKAITAILAGAALAVSGLQMQTLFKNPLAGPSVLGITSGASLGVAVLMLGTGNVAGSYAIRQLGIGGSWLIILASCLGSAMVLVIIIGISMRIRDNIVLLIIGLLLSNLIIAIISIWQYFSSPEQIQDYLIWTFGSLGGVSNKQLNVLCIVTLTGLIFTIGTSKFLNLLLLGENYASSMGINIKMVKIAIIFSTSLLAGAITGFCGPIGFVGIAVPHLCRSLLNSSDHRTLIPACCLMGANMMLLCDVIAQLPGHQTVLPINSVTAIIGSPIVMWVILKRRNLKTSFN